MTSRLTEYLLFAAPRLKKARLHCTRAELQFCALTARDE